MKDKSKKSKKNKINKDDGYKISGGICYKGVIKIPYTLEEYLRIIERK